jgi:hypothetical protein
VRAFRARGRHPDPGEHRPLVLRDDQNDPIGSFDPLRRRIQLHFGRTERERLPVEHDLTFFGQKLRGRLSGHQKQFFERNFRSKTKGSFFIKKKKKFFGSWKQFFGGSGGNFALKQNFSDKKDELFSALKVAKNLNI